MRHPTAPDQRGLGLLDSDVKADVIGAFLPLLNMQMDVRDVYGTAGCTSSMYGSTVVQ